MNLNDLRKKREFEINHVNRIRALSKYISTAYGGNIVSDYNIPYETGSVSPKYRGVETLAYKPLRFQLIMPTIIIYCTSYNQDELGAQLDYVVTLFHPAQPAPLHLVLELVEPEDSYRIAEVVLTEGDERETIKEKYKTLEDVFTDHPVDFEQTDATRILELINFRNINC